MKTDLPNGCEIGIDDKNTLLKFNGEYVVTKNTRQKKFFRGLDDAAFKRARTFAWRFVEGYEDGYTLESQVLM